MRSSIRAAIALLAVCGLAQAFAETKFSGTWEAKSGDKVFLVLKLETGDKIKGTLNAGSIHLDDDGNLLEAGAVEDREEPIFFAHADGDKLEFDFQDGDNEVMHFELRIVGEDKAELRIVDAHLPKIKPFPLKKKG